MWILTHKNDPLGDTRILKPNNSYLIGRDKDVDILFTSGKASRHQLKLQLGSTNPSSHTPLSVIVLSRAKSKIQDNWYRLSKGEQEQTLDLTQEQEIIIECADDGNGTDTPVTVKWHEFNVFCEDKNLVQSVSQLVRVVDLDQASYFVYIEESDLLKRAVVKGIPILNRDWLVAITENNTNFLDIEKYIIPEYSSNPDRSTLFDNIKIFSNEHISWLDVILAETDIPNHIRQNITTEQFILIGIASPGLETETIENIWQAIISCSLGNLKLNKLSQLKRPSSASSSVRKRRKYEKVDKLHFFSLTESEPSQVEDSLARVATSETSLPPVEETEETSPVGEIKETSLVQEVKQAIPVEEVKEAIPVEEMNEVTPFEEINEKSLKVSTEETTNPRKRKSSIEIKTEHPYKIGRFIPKLSLVDAIKQTKQQLNDSINQEFGISEDQELDPDLNLSNLAIVEVVNMPLRIPPSNKETTTVSNNPRNQKKFKKNITLKSKFLRSYVPMNSIVIDNNISFSKPVTIGSDFTGLMNDVKGFAPEEEQLFVPEEEESSVTQLQTIEDDADDNDDDDDDDDQPKFGFS